LKPGPAWTTWLGFAAVSTAAAIATASLGSLAAGRSAWIAGDGSFPAGCLVSLIGSWVGALPLARAIGERSGRSGAGIPVAAIGKASLYRLLGTVVAGLGVALSGDWQRRSLLLAIAASYVLLLAAETGWLMRRLRVGNARTLDSTIGDAQDGA
jgi:hypothetical protein